MDSKLHNQRLRYSEAFYSVQGEGRFVGVPSVFLRTFGCNFRCMNFGIDRHPDRAEKLKQGIKYNPEVKALLDDGVLDKVDKFEDLPIYIQVVTLMPVSIQNSKNI